MQPYQEELPNNNTFNTRNNINYTNKLRIFTCKFTFELGTKAQTWKFDSITIFNDDLAFFAKLNNESIDNNREIERTIFKCR